MARLNFALSSSIGIVVVLALVARSAPFLPNKARLDDEVRSLADVSSVRLAVQQHCKELVDEGFDASAAEALVEKQLDHAAINVVEEDTAPMLKIEIYGSTEPNVPSALAFLVSLKLVQPVTIDRLDEKMLVPTFTMVRGGMEASDRVRSTAEAELAAVVDTFLVRCQAATRESRQRESQ